MSFTLAGSGRSRTSSARSAAATYGTISDADGCTSSPSGTWLKFSSPAAPGSSAATSSATRCRPIPTGTSHARQADLRRAARENLHDVMDNPRHTFVHGDICDARGRRSARRARRLSSCTSPPRPTSTGRSWRPATSSRPTSRARSCCSKRRGAQPTLKRFVQISTDEVYGSVPEGSSTETDELRPRNPYAASKAGADRLAYSYWATYDVPVIVTRASNNYGPYQFPEKVLPLFVTNLMDDIPVPLYGDGGNVRDWLHVLDHCRAHRSADRTRAPTARSTTSAAATRCKNIDLTHTHPEARWASRPSLIKPVPDRQGHDRRYASTPASCARMGWAPQVDLRAGPARDRRVVPARTSGGGGRSRNATPAYKAYNEAQYGKR